MLALENFRCLSNSTAVGSKDVQRRHQVFLTAGIEASYISMQNTEIFTSVKTLIFLLEPVMMAELRYIENNGSTLTFLH